MASLPTEILVEILSQKVFTASDLARISLVCYAWNQIARGLPRHVDFALESRNLTPWRLIRCLLINPEIGKPITSIEANSKNKQTGVDSIPKWVWTDDEAAKIQQIGAKHKFRPQMVSSMLEGWNSEPLLVLLLYYTPSLQSLELGRLSQPGEFLPRDEQGYILDRFWFNVSTRDLVVSSPSIDRTNWSPGLSNLKILSWTIPKDEANEDSATDIPVMWYDVWPLLFAPSIRSVSIGSMSTSGYYYHIPMGASAIYTGFSTIRKLSITTYESSFQMIPVAHTTRHLTELYIRGGASLGEEDVESENLKMSTNFVDSRIAGIAERNNRHPDLVMNVELLVYEFLEYNKGNLKAENVDCRFVVYILGMDLVWEPKTGLVQEISTE
ncbi:hypothetical protein TWF281_006996 [Arthrobotrys megalospora]